jgi:hypothetical protein
MLRHRLLLLAAVVCSSSPHAGAASKTPPPPDEYRVKLRYHIPSARDQHVIHYDAMIKYLKSIGFKYKAGPPSDREDPTKNSLTGTIASQSARKLLGNAHVAAVLLLPPKFEPARPTDPVKVRIDLASGFSLTRQRILADQAAALLETLGFHEAVAYDHRGFTRLVGTLPAGQLDTLLRDLRAQPSGWLVPVVPLKELPAPIRNVSPVLLTEVAPEPAGTPPLRPLPTFQAPQKALEKVSPDLRALVAQADQKRRRPRMEVILAVTPRPTDRAWRHHLEDAAPGLVIEGQLGPLVTVRARVGRVPKLAALAEVAVVRLPRAARPQVVRPGVPAKDDKVLRGMGVQEMGVPHKGVRVAVIDGDFRGFRRLLKQKRLPETTQYIDLTAERNPTLEPDPFPKPAAGLGHGTRCALALARAMAGSGVQLILIRIDPACPYQLQEVARHINGEKYRSENLAHRLAELENDREDLRERSKELAQERKKALDNFSDDPADVAKRKAYFKKQKEFDGEQEDLRDREERYLEIGNDLRSLRGVQIVSSSLVWTDGYPVDGSSPLSRYFNDRPFRAALWFQSAGNTRGQTWAGVFRDGDGNGVMEFAGPNTKLRPGRWTRELNFLGWQPFGKRQELDLPAKAQLKVSMQWREPHDPEFLRRGEDLYRQPLAKLRLVLLRQRDPSGTKLATDDMEEVAATPGYGDRYGLPQRLANEPASATYEQTLELTVPEAGRYALRVEGRVPDSIRPASVPTLPVQRKTWELRPRIFVEVVDNPSRAAGRPVFVDYPTGAGSLGMPADSRQLITVGAADRSKKLERYSASGPALNLDLLVKPNVLVTDPGRWGEEGATAYGTSLATPLAAGLAGRLLFTGTSRSELQKRFLGDRTTVLRVP